MLKLEVNGQAREVDVEPATPLLYVLRNDLRLNGPKFGCGQAQCGACTVMMNGEAVFSCVLPVSVAVGQKVKTIEGLGTQQQPGPVQRAFIQEQSAQCGYCIPGMMMRAQALLEQNASPTMTQIRQHMSTNLCRCGTHMRIVRAVERAVVFMKVADAGEQPR
jgi:nicotinate dehydrogenase subunit A